LERKLGFDWAAQLLPGPAARKDGRRMMPCLFRNFVAAQRFIFVPNDSCNKLSVLRGQAAARQLRDNHALRQARANLTTEPNHEH
jgi:hypothetical protein